MIAICLIAVITARAGDGDEFFTLNGGFLFNSTVNASFGYERELDYGNAVELFGEVGDRWHEDPTCGKICTKIFWQDYYWGGGILYKKSLKRFKNSTLRLRFGPECGSHEETSTSDWKEDLSITMSSPAVYILRSSRKTT